MPFSVLASFLHSSPSKSCSRCSACLNSVGGLNAVFGPGFAPALHPVILNRAPAAALVSIPPVLVSFPRVGSSDSCCNAVLFFVFSALPGRAVVMCSWSWLSLLVLQTDLPLQHWPPYLHWSHHPMECALAAMLAVALYPRWLALCE